MPRIKLLSIGLTVILLIGIIYFGTGYFQERQAVATLRDKMNTTNQLLALIPAPAADLNTRLAAEQQANRDAKLKVLPFTADTTAIINDIFSTADSFNISALPLITNEWRNKTVGGNDYRVLDIDIAIEGSLPDVMGFINSLYSEDFNITALNSFTLNRTAATGDIITGSVQLEIFTQPFTGAVN